MSLNKKDINKFHENGFVIIKNFLKKEINKIFFQMEEMIDIPIKNISKKNLKALMKNIYIY